MRPYLSRKSGPAGREKNNMRKTGTFLPADASKKVKTKKKQDRKKTKKTVLLKN